MVEQRAPIRVFSPYLLVEESAGKIALSTDGMGSGWKTYSSTSTNGAFYYQCETDISGLVRQGKTLFPQYVTWSRWPINGWNFEGASGRASGDVFVGCYTTKQLIDNVQMHYQFVQKNDPNLGRLGSYNDLISYQWKQYATNLNSPTTLMLIDEDAFGTLDATAGEKLYHTFWVIFQSAENVTTGNAQIMSTVLDIGQAIDKEPKLEYIYRLKRSYEVDQE
tara:strand:- start:967 stop:1629 length:663 start_codon:yes stop_codon:yes gene_type:complete